MHPTSIFTADEIRLQTQRILNFPAFQNSPILSRFLEFIVDETVQQDGQCLKEYSIAINVLHRRPDFNPHDDAVVRIHAGRLRRALNEYYLIEGMEDEIVISIPKGSYIPQFELGNTKHANPSRKPGVPEPLSRPVVAIFPFRVVPRDSETLDFAAILSDQFCAALSMFPEFSTIGHYSSEMYSKIEANMLDAARIAEADFVLTGNIQKLDLHIRVQVNLVVASTGEVIMTKSFARNNDPSGLLDIQDEIIPSVIAELGGFQGTIFQKIEKASVAKARSHSSIRRAISHYYKFQQTPSIYNFQGAFSALEYVAKEYPDQAVYLAMLGELQFFGNALGHTTNGDSNSQGFRYILQSLKTDSHCQQAWYAMAVAHMFRKERVACLDAGMQCASLNPNHPTMVTGAAATLICAGYFDEGFAIMKKAIGLNPFYSWWVYGACCLYFLYKEDYASALAYSKKMNSEEVFWDPLLRVVCLFYLKRKKEAKVWVSVLLSVAPNISEELEAMLSSFILSDELKERILIGFRGAALKNEVSSK